MIQVISRKCFSQIQNGESFTDNLSDFSQNLTGSVMERVMLELEIELSVISEASASDTIEISGLNTFERPNGGFLSDGWNVGDTFTCNFSGVFTGTIISVSDIEITFSVDTGLPVNGTYTSGQITITSDYLAAVYQFNLIENSDNAQDFINLVDGSGQLFTANGINTSYVNFIPAPGSKSWQTGPAKIKRNSFSNGVANYTIQHEFIILPYYLDSFLTALQQAFNPPLFDGANTLKYIFKIDFRTVISNPNRQNSFFENTNLGAVGWFNENFNGGVNSYNISSVSYTDVASGQSVTGLQADKQTRVDFLITDSGLFSVNTYIGVYVSKLLTSTQYAKNSTEYKTLWLYDNAVRQAGVSVTGLTGIIKSISSVIININQMSVSVVVEYSNTQSAQINAGDDFLIGLQVGNRNLGRALSNMVIISELGSYVKANDVPDLMLHESFEVLYHPQVESDLGATNFRGWIQDGIMLRHIFKLDISKGAFLRDLTYKLIAKSASNEFTISQFQMDLSKQFIVNDGGFNKQIFYLDTTRGFQLANGDFFNRVRLKEYVSENPLRYDEVAVTTGINNITFGAFTSNDYVVLFNDIDGVGLDLNITKQQNGFTIEAFGNGTIAYVAILNTSINGIRAGVNTDGNPIFASLSTTDYAILINDLDGVGADFSGIEASKSFTDFTFVPLSSGNFNYLAVRNSGLSDIRSGYETIIVGTNNINFAVPFGNTDFTLLIFDINNVGNIYNRVKNSGGFDVDALVDTNIYYIAILNP